MINRIDKWIVSNKSKWSAVAAVATDPTTREAAVAQLPATEGERLRGREK